MKNAFKQNFVALVNVWVCDFSYSKNLSTSAKLKICVILKVFVIMLSINFIGLCYTPTSNYSCFWHDGPKGTGPYDTYDAAKEACQGSSLCNMFTKKHDEKYYTCPLHSRNDDYPNSTLFRPC